MLKNLLMIVDERATAAWLPSYFEERGWSVHLIASVGMAADLLPRLPPADVALIDAVLKDADGYALCQGIRGCFPGTFIIMMSARAGQVAHLKARAAGANAYLSKPFRLTELAGLVESREAGS